MEKDSTKPNFKVVANAWLTNIYKVASALFDDFWKKVYDGGKKKVRNPNPKTRDRYPEIAASTAMHNEKFSDAVYKEYDRWLRAVNKTTKEIGSQFGVQLGHTDCESLYRISSYRRQSVKNTLSTILKLSGIAGLPPSPRPRKFSLYHIGGGAVGIEARGGGVEDLERSINFREKTIYNASLFLSPKAPKGTGSQILVTQVKEARKNGFKAIETHAGGSYLERKDMVGYFVWPLLGYQPRTWNKKVTDNLLKRYDQLKPVLKPKEQKEVQALLDKLKGSKINNLSELMRTPEGRKLWWYLGWDQAMVFNLTKGSNSDKVLNAYLAKKAKGKKKTAAQEAPQDGVSIEMLIFREDLELLEEVWDELSAQGALTTPEDATTEQSHPRR